MPVTKLLHSLLPVFPDIPAVIQIQFLFTSGNFQPMVAPGQPFHRPIQIPTHGQPP